MLSGMKESVNSWLLLLKYKAKMVLNPWAIIREQRIALTDAYGFIAKDRIFLLQALYWLEWQRSHLQAAQEMLKQANQQILEQHLKAPEEQQHKVH